MSLGEFRENIFSIVGGEAANERLLGQQSRSRESFGASGAALAATFDEARQLEDEKSRKSASEIAFLSLLDQLNAQREWLGGRIAEAEAGFVERYGEDWREQFAQRILDPDDIPQRREGESMEDYRARLDQALIDEMLDENGEIKQEYMDDPELRDWADWARDQYLIQGVDSRMDRVQRIANDKTLSPQERETGYDALLNDQNHQQIEEMRWATRDEATAAELTDRFDADRDRVAATEATLASDDAAFTS